MKKLLVAFCALALAAGCTKKSKSDYGLNLKETLRVNISTEPPTLDWHKSTDTTSAHISNNIMEGLTAYDLKDPDLKVIPALAESWVSTDNAKKWTIKLRQDVKWSDGKPFVAQHVVDGWERLLNPKTAAEYAYFLFAIKNAQKYNEGKIKDFSQIGVKAVDDHTVTVELEKSIGYFPSMLTHQSTFPIRKDVVEAHGDKWTEPENIVTLGPFNLKVWDHDKALVMERNEGYYGPKAKIKNVLCYMILEQATAINLFDAGKIDALITLPATELEILKKRAEYHRINSLLIYYYGFNVKKKPMNNPDIRKAISMAIDRRQLVQVLRGGQTPLTSWVPAGMFGHESSMGAAFNVEQAKALLKKAGVTDPKTLPKLVIGFNTNEDHKMIAENIQAQLKTNLGINVELQNQEWKVYLKQLQTDPPHIYRMGWQADYPDPSNFMDIMLSYSENNRTRWGNKQYDKLVEQANGSTDQGARKSLYAKAQEILVEKETPVAPLYNGVNQYLISKRVSDFPVNPLFQLEFKNVTVK